MSGGGIPGADLKPTGGVKRKQSLPSEKGAETKKKAKDASSTKPKVIKRPPLAAKAARKLAKLKRQQDRRAAGRDNEYVILTVPEEKRDVLWARAVKGKVEVDRKDEKMPMTNCWTYGDRAGYSYISLGHGVSQLKLTQLAMWAKERKVAEKGAVIAHRCHFKRCFNPDHLYVTTTKQNSRCNGCPAWTEVEGKVVRICAHGPEWCMRRDPNCPEDYASAVVAKADA